MVNGVTAIKDLMGRNIPEPGQLDDRIDPIPNPGRTTSRKLPASMRDVQAEEGAYTSGIPPPPRSLEAKA